MNRLLRRAKTPPVVLATILAIGLLVGWLFMYAVFVIAGSIFVSRPAAYEKVIVLRDGQTYVSRNNGMNNITFRTLEGQPLDPAELGIDVDSAANPVRRAAETVYLGNGNRRPFEAAEVLDWGQRIIGFRDRNSPPMFWYEMHDADPVGSVYFVGFDAQSKLPIGYVDREGFRPDMPQKEDRIAGVPGGMYRHSYTATYANEPRMAGTSLVFIESEGKLLAFDVGRRAVEEINLPGDVISLGEYQTTVNISPDSADATGSSAETDVVNTAVRMADAVAILDGRGKTIRTVPIPEELREKVFNLHLCTEPLAIFETGTYPALTEQHELHWADDKGEITRRADVRLLGQGVAATPRQTAWNGIVMIPVPSLIALGSLAIHPLTYVKDGTSSNFLAAIERSLSETWPPLLTITIVGALLAALVYRRHRRVSDRGAVVWTVFVFLSGLPGVLAYWWHRSWPPTEKCPACSAAAPRNRESCLACGAEFPLPASAGCEIFV